jgi:hypothetical protein
MSRRSAAAGVVVLLAALVGMAAGSPAASASDTVVCALDGETQSISPPMSMPGGGGNLSFAAQGVCRVNDGAPARTSAVASGTYFNQLCIGSFTADFSMTLYVGGYYSGGPMYGAGVHIDPILGGVGQMRSSGTGFLYGVAHMMPAQLGTDGKTCATQLLLRLAFEGSL